MIRACYKCIEFVDIYPQYYFNRRIVAAFDEEHKGHPLITLEWGHGKEYWNPLKAACA